MSEPTLAALRAAHMTIYETTIEFEWEAHPHLTEAEAFQVPKIIDNLLAEHKTRANLLTTTQRNPPMSDRDRIDIKITLANGATAHLKITTDLSYQAHKVNELLDRAINAIKETR